MLSVFLLLLAMTITGLHFFRSRRKDVHETATTFLAYILLLNVGIMSLIAAVMHVFFGSYTAANIGWSPGSPFQFEIGMANLSYGVLGVMAFWVRGRFWEAVLLGWSTLLIGCFVGHMMEYYHYHNTAPYNFGAYVWVNDLILPFLALGLLTFIRSSPQKKTKKMAE